MVVRARRGRLFLAPMLASIACMGCAKGGAISSAWYNAFLDPSEVGNFRENRVNEIQRTISFRDKPAGIIEAVDPTPDDLVVTVSEYEVGPGDVLGFRLEHFEAVGQPMVFPKTVDELGRVDIPQIGLLDVDGLTVTEIKREVIQKAKAMGIYREDDDPVVLVTVESAQQRLYHLAGDVQFPYTFPIPYQDFRLREALLSGGGIHALIETVYVTRGEPRRKRVAKSSKDEMIPSASGEDGEEMTAPPVSPVTVSPVTVSPVTVSPVTVSPVTVSPVTMSVFDAMAGSPPASASSEAQPSSRPDSQGGLVLPAEIVEQELIEAIAPGPSSTRTGEQTRTVQQDKPASQPGTDIGQPSPRIPSRIPSYIFVNDKFIEAPPAATREAPGQGPSPRPAEGVLAPETDVPDESVDWEELASEDQPRVIRIPAEKLRHLDSNYNIVIRPGDYIHVDAGPMGMFYMTGHVMRPGPYPFSGQEVTVTQAIAMAGGLDPLAWPTRCEVRRRIDGDREEITQWDLARIIEGKDPGFFLKPNDEIRIGTHAIAPLLATIRNSFRLTYGFGFVWDRNFADIEMMGGRGNPTERRRVERQQKWGNLFN